MIMIFIKILVTLYADDTIILSDNINDFQQILNIFDYCNSWNLKINSSRTKITIFRDHSRTRNVHFFIAGDETEIVKEIKYLGVLFKNNGRFDQCCKAFSSVAFEATSLLKKRIVNLNITVDCQLKLFDQTILPILLYGSEICSFEKLQSIEKVHLDFIRSILKMKKRTPLIMVYVEFGRYPIKFKQKRELFKIIIKHWSNILTDKYSKLSHKMYSILR